MRQLTEDQFEAFLAERRVAVIHFDADWDVGYRPGMRRKMAEAEAALGDQANFAEVDTDTQQELAKSVGIVNVPTVAYYRDGNLVAALIGATQDVRTRVERVIQGKLMGYKDGNDSA